MWLYLFMLILFFSHGCSSDPNSSPGGAVVLAMDAVARQDIHLLIKATYGRRAGHANPSEVGNKMNKIIEKFSVDRNTKITIGRTFKEDKGLKASVYFTLTQDGKKQQFVMKAVRKHREWVAILDSIAKNNRRLW